MLHAAEVGVQQRRLATCLQDGLPAAVRELEEVRHAGQSGEGVIAACLQQAFRVQRLAQAGAHLWRPGLCGGLVGTFVRVPHIGQARAVSRVGVLAAGVDDHVARGRVRLGAVDDLVVLALVRREAHGCVGDARGVVRVSAAVHVVVHVVVRGRAVLAIAEQVAESLA